MTEAPGPGQWYASPEHMPVPSCTLYIDLLPRVASGWGEGAERYGLPPNRARFGFADRWGYYSPGAPGPVDVDALNATAAAVLASRPWREDLRRWHDEERPAAMAVSHTLLDEDLDALDAAALADHLRRAVDHFVTGGTGHFARTSIGSAAMGAFLQAAGEWELDARALLLALPGRSAASRSGDHLLQRIRLGLRDAGLLHPRSLDDLWAVGGDVGAALRDLERDYAWRVPNEPSIPTLAERPSSLLAAIVAALAEPPRRERPSDQALAPFREQVPAEERARFDALAEVASEGYGHNDDNSVVLFSLPLGLVRRAALAVGRRADLVDPNDAVECTVDELVALALGDGPTADELARRTDERQAAAAVVPAPVLGEPFPPEPEPDWGPSTRALMAMIDAFSSVAWSRPAAGEAGATVGTQAVRGRALVVADPVEALERLEPGDILVALTTTAVFNTIFPLVAGVAVEHGGFMGHAAILARELGLPAVIGLPGLLARVNDGDQIELDPVKGTVTVIGSR